MSGTGVALISTTQGEGHGAEAVLDHLLRAWKDDELPLTIAAPPGGRICAAAADTGIDFVELKTRRDAFLPNAVAARQIRNALNGRLLVHAWSSRAFEIAVWLGEKLSVPVTAGMHDHPAAGFISNARRKLMRSAANRMRKLACVSEAVRTACAEAGYRCPMQVLHNGIEDCRRTPSAAPYVRIGFLGMYAKFKGFAIVRDWIRSNRIPEAKWRLYGKPAKTILDEATALAADYAGCVRLEGSRTTRDIFDEIDILVHCSEQFDSLPTVLIEAARAGIPAVASSAGGAPEIVIDGETGFIFEPVRPVSGLDGLQALVSDPELRRGMGRRARRRYEQRFRVADMTARYRDFWRSAIKV